MPAISFQGLTKRYGHLLALSNLTLDVCQGEIFGFLGLNGEGKTTAIRLLLDLLRPTSGSACIFGRDCWMQNLETRARIGYLPAELGLYLDLTGLETLDFFAKLQDHPLASQYRQERDRNMRYDRSLGKTDMTRLPRRDPKGDDAAPAGSFRRSQPAEKEHLWPP